jgi:hypothetical protein
VDAQANERLPELVHDLLSPVCFVDFFELSTQLVVEELARCVVEVLILAMAKIIVIIVLAKDNWRPTSKFTGRLQPPVISTIGEYKRSYIWDNEDFQIRKVRAISSRKQLHNLYDRLEKQVNSIRAWTVADLFATLGWKISGKAPSLQQVLFNMNFLGFFHFRIT